MQRVSAFLPSWDKRQSHNKAGSKSGRSWWSNRVSASTATVNATERNTTSSSSSRHSKALSRVQREAFWPTTLDIECNKAGRILKTFCHDGFLTSIEDDKPDADTSAASDDAGRQTPIKMTKKIPQRVIENAAGIAVFSCMRNGLWLTGSGGSGILIARKSDGTWSPPSGIMLHTPTLSFIIGVDVYDCVLIVNTLAALESITRPRVTLGEDVALAGGPLVTLDDSEADFKWDDLGDTVLTYMKARGQHRTVNLTGSILAERSNENERFYSSQITQMDILAGNVDRHVEETMPMFEVIKMAEGRIDIDHQAIAKLGQETAPGDATIQAPVPVPASPQGNFGIVNHDDPDPFGVLALEMAGLEIREAGSKFRPTSSQFGLSSLPTSPIVAHFNRQSMETPPIKSNRGSYLSSHTNQSQVTDSPTQAETTHTPGTTPSPEQSDKVAERSIVERIAEVREEEEQEKAIHPHGQDTGYSTVGDVAKGQIAPRSPDGDALKPDTDGDTASRASSLYEKSIHEEAGDQPVVEEAASQDTPRISVEEEIPSEPKQGIQSGSEGLDGMDGDDEVEDDEEEEDEEDGEEDEEDEPVIYEIAQVQPAVTQVAASRTIQAKGNMVTIPKRLPPPLPTRSPARVSRSSKSDIGDVSHLRNLSVQTSSSGHLTTETLSESRSASPADDQTNPDRPSSRTSTFTDKSLAEDDHADMKAIETAPEPESDGELHPKQPDGLDKVDDDLAIEAEIQVTTPEPDDSEVQKTTRASPTSDKVDTEASDRGIEKQQNDASFRHQHHMSQGSIDDHQSSEVSSSSGTPKKQSGSVCTGLTEDRWSMDESSLTTPTSDREFTDLHDSDGDDTPTKTLSAAEQNEKNPLDLANTPSATTQVTDISS